MSARLGDDFIDEAEGLEARWVSIIGSRIIWLWSALACTFACDRGSKGLLLSTVGVASSDCERSSEGLLVSTVGVASPEAIRSISLANFPFNLDASEGSSKTTSALKFVSFVEVVSAMLPKPDAICWYTSS